MLLQRQRFLVAGLSRSGVSAAEFLLERGAKVYCFDDVEEGAVAQNAALLEQKGCTIVRKEDLERVVSESDVLVLSPGIAVDHPLPVAFKRAKKRVMGETELAALFLTCPVIAVSGTNGKTTTVSMIDGVLRSAGMKSVACGNIGKPMTSCVAELGRDGVAVAEISSFQLETLSSLKPHIAVLLNVSEDHLNRHYSMENYLFLKQRLLKNCTESEYAVLNYDDFNTREMGERCKANVVWVSLRERVRGGYLLDGAFYFMEERLFPVDELPLEGEHNLFNALACVCVAKLMGVSTQVILHSLKTYKGAAHRLQRIGEVNGVTFIDDSKATNVDSAVKAIKSVKGEIILLLGGKDKGYPYEELFEQIKLSGVTHAVLYGENAFKLLNCALKRHFTAVTLCRPFDVAVRVAYLTAKSGQTVLLSPASASFDSFTSYEERGERFVSIMRQLQMEKGDGKEEGQSEEGA